MGLLSQVRCRNISEHLLCQSSALKFPFTLQVEKQQEEEKTITISVQPQTDAPLLSGLDLKWMQHEVKATNLTEASNI